MSLLIQRTPVKRAVQRLLLNKNIFAIAPQDARVHHESAMMH
jgi:hypothetical protein